MHPTLPRKFRALYRPKTDNDVRAESFGQLTAARIGGTDTDPRPTRGTFDDQAIFGPVVSFRCACGKYDSREYDGVICDRCGVKFCTREERRIRCAHINLPEPIIHPLADVERELTTVPVLPVAFVESPAGGELLRAYERVLRATNTAEVSDAFEAVLNVLAPVLITAHEWDLSERLLIAHGMALKAALA